MSLTERVMVLLLAIAIPTNTGTQGGLSSAFSHAIHKVVSAIIEC